jgi:predicted secreted protein
MRSLIRITAALATVVLASSALGLGGAAQAAKNPTLVVTELPAQVRLIPGESILLSLSTNRTTGYTWTTKVKGTKKAIKVSEGAYSAPASADGMVGVPGTTVWSIEALKRGTAVVDIIETSPGGEVGKVSKLTIIVMKR